jgi:hypothetical protein
MRTARFTRASDCARALSIDRYTSNALPLQNLFDKNEDAKLAKRGQVKSDTISKFNRDTLWLATGLLGTVVFAALVLAFQERRPKATQAERDLLLNANPARVSSVIAKSSNVNGEMTPRAGSGVDPEFTETPVQKNPSSQRGSAASTPTAVLALTPEMNRNAHRQDSSGARGLKTRNRRNRSSVLFGSAYVKRRLIELWHQSLAKSE